jgi:tRNA dimethylallyltransferase
MPSAAPLLVVLTGPTGTGKSTLALRLVAQLHGHLPLEIISMDSAQVYRGMDIGTAKATAAERSRVPHHLIDIRDPLEGYSAGEFVRDALQAVREIQARGAVPLIVGGTLLYLRALYHGLAVLPLADAALRAQIDARALQLGWPALHAELAHVDPLAAARIARGDAQRIQRALEVWQLTGAPISQWQQRTQGAREQFHWLRFALLPQEGPAGRAALRERLAVRLAAMLEAGFVAEVQRLYARGDLTLRHAAVRAVGYRQLWSVFSAGAALADAQHAALIATAQLAKRQLTWLRREPQLTPLDAAAVGLAEGLGAQILAAARA